MKKSVPVVLLTALVLCLLLTKEASAQNTIAYATVDYDEETNTIYGYAYTEPDYAASIYYRTAYVGAALKDGDNTQLVNGSKTCYDCRAELNLQASGNGNPPYKIQSGHYVFLTYYVSNYWDSYAYQYRTGYLDYRYYSYFTSGGPGYPVFDIPNFFEFIGRNPQAVTPSVNMFLGTLLTEFLEQSANRITYTTATVSNLSVNFSQFNTAQLPLNEASPGGSSYCAGNASNSFTLKLDFVLPANTSDVFQDGRSRMPYDDPNDQYQQSGPFQITDLNLSGDIKTGRVSVTIFRKNPPSSYPKKKVRIIVAGRISGGQSFATTALVTLTCSN